MRRVGFPLAAVAVTILAVLSASAFAQMPAPKPAPELSKLDYFAGNWIADGDIKPGPMGPGGKMTSTDEGHWMDGKFFMVLHSKFKGAMGDGMSLAIMGYDPEKKVYTYNEFNSMGQAEHAEGNVAGDTWTWTSDENFGGQMFKGRYTMKVGSPTSYTFKYEISKDGTEWTTVMDGTATKK
jgi:Protein of unknown function (DUF1579)